MYKYILFDLDGTLTDPGIGITNSVAYALKKFGIENKDRTELYKFIGPPLKESFAKYYGLTDSQCDTAVDEYRVYFKAGGMFENKVYEGVPEMLEQLKAQGKKLYIATSKPEEFAITILKHFDLCKFFDFVGGASMDGKRSEKSDVIKYTLEKANINDIKNAIMVGDRFHDILGAKSVNMSSVGVTYGYGSYDELKNAGADYIINTPAEILNLL